jgi:hypothetical protein
LFKFLPTEKYPGRAAAAISVDALVGKAERAILNIKQDDLTWSALPVRPSDKHEIHDTDETCSREFVSLDGEVPAASSLPIPDPFAP